MIPNFDANGNPGNDTKEQIIQDNINELNRQDEKTRKERATRCFECCGLGFNSGMIPGVNLNDYTQHAYVNGDFWGCIALCRMHAERALKWRIIYELVSQLDPACKKYADEKIRNMGEMDDETRKSRHKRLMMSYVHERKSNTNGALDVNIRTVKNQTFGSLLSMGSEYGINKDTIKMGEKINNTANKWVHSNVLEEYRGTDIDEKRLQEECKRNALELLKDVNEFENQVAPVRSSFTI